MEMVLFYLEAFGSYSAECRVGHYTSLQYRRAFERWTVDR